MPEQKTILVTGANRGIGLEIVKQYLALGNYKIIACAREPEQADDLNQLASDSKNIHILKLDITNDAHREELIKKLNNQVLDYVFLNAGIYGNKEKPCQFDPSNMATVIATNSIAQIMLARALWPFMQKSDDKQLIVITSKMGSIGDNQSGGTYSYRASKAALNALMRSWAIDLYSQGLRVLLIHPGWVQTRMGGTGGLITCSESVSGIRKTIATYGSKAKGEFRAYDGTTISW